MDHRHTMTVDEAARTMADLVNSDRPFTPQERAAILTHIDMVTRFLKTNNRVWGLTMLTSHASAIMVGIIVAKVFL